MDLPTQPVSGGCMLSQIPSANVLGTLAELSCSDNRARKDLYGVGLHPKMLKRLDRDHPRRGLSFTGQTLIQPGAMAGGALMFAEPETLLLYKKETMEGVDVAQRIRDLSGHRNISYEQIETLFEAKGVRDLVLMVHGDCAEVRKKLCGHTSEEEEYRFLRRVLAEATSFFRARRSDVSIYTYIVHLDKTKSCISHLEDTGAEISETATSSERSVA